MQKSAVVYVRVVLDVLPVPEPVVVDPVQKLIASLDEYEGPHRLRRLIVLRE